MRIFLTTCLLLALPSSDLSAQGVVTASANSPAVDHHELDRIRRVVRGLGPRASTPAQLVQLARDLPSHEAAELFLGIGKDYFSSGQWDLGGTVLLQLLEKYPDEPVAAEATLRLVQLYSSSEVAHAERQVQDSATELRLPAGWREKHEQAEATHTDPGMWRYALFLANGQFQKHPELAEHPALAFQCSVAARLSGNTSAYKSWLSLVKHKREAAEWRTRAKAEDWLAESRKGEPPMALAHCSVTDRAPHLDGSLDDACWQNAPSVIAQASFHLAYDSEYLYVAARCQKLIGGDYAADSRTRSYDADLAGHDQVRLWLDVDRDYATWFELAIDHRGWTGDRCWLNAGWNPKWFVAAADDAAAWTVEAAIPWSELAGRKPRAGEAWAVAAERRQPGVTAGDGPVEFGLLVFE